MLVFFCFDVCLFWFDVVGLLTGFLLVNLEKLGLTRLLGIFGTKSKLSIRPEKRTSGRDLDGGGNLVARKEANMSQKNAGRSKKYFVTGRASFPALFNLFQNIAPGICRSRRDLHFGIFCDYLDLDRTIQKIWKTQKSWFIMQGTVSIKIHWHNIFEKMPQL